MAGEITTDRDQLREELQSIGEPERDLEAYEILQQTKGLQAPAGAAVRAIAGQDTYERNLRTLEGYRQRRLERGEKPFQYLEAGRAREDGRRFREQLPFWSNLFTDFTSAFPEADRAGVDERFATSLDPLADKQQTANKMFYREMTGQDPDTKLWGIQSSNYAAQALGWKGGPKEIISDGDFYKLAGASLKSEQADIDLADKAFLAARKAALDGKPLSDAIAETKKLAGEDWKRFEPAAKQGFSGVLSDYADSELKAIRPLYEAIAEIQGGDFEKLTGKPESIEAFAAYGRASQRDRDKIMLAVGETAHIEGEDVESFFSRFYQGLRGGTLAIATGTAAAAVRMDADQIRQLLEGGKVPANVESLEGKRAGDLLAYMDPAAGGYAQDPERAKTRPLTGEERKMLTTQMDAIKGTADFLMDAQRAGVKVKRYLDDRREGMLDRLADYSVIFAESAPSIAMAFSSRVGFVTTGLSYGERNFSTMRANNPNADPGALQRWAYASGMVEAGIDRLQFQTMGARLPKLRAALLQWGKPGAALNFVGRVGAITAMESGQELLQDFTEPLTEEVAQALREDIKGPDWIKVLEQERRALGDIVGVSMLFGIIGATGSTISEHLSAPQIKQALSDKQGLLLAGYSEETAKTISTTAQDNPLAAAELLKAAQAETPIEERKANSQAAREKLEAEAAAFDPAAAGLPVLSKLDDGRVQIDYPDRATEIVDGQAEALEAVRQWDDDTSVSTTQANRAYIDFLTEYHASSPETAYSGQTQQSLGMIGEVARQSAEATAQARGRIEIAMRQAGVDMGIDEIDLDQVPILGVSQNRIARGITTIANRFAKEATPLTVIEEHAEGIAKWLVDSGRIPEAKVIGWLRDAEQRTGHSLLSDNVAVKAEAERRQEIVEAWSYLAKANAIGQVQDSALPSPVKAFFRAFKDVIHAALRIAADFLRVRGDLDPEFTYWLDVSAGVNEEFEKENLVRQMEAELDAAAFEGLPEIRDTLKGRLPHPETLKKAGLPFSGELRRIHEGLKAEAGGRGAGTRKANEFFLPVGELGDLDHAREKANEKGFGFATPGEMIDALDLSVSYGKPQHAMGADQSFSIDLNLHEGIFTRHVSSLRFAADPRPPLRVGEVLRAAERKFKGSRLEYRREEVPSEGLRAFRDRTGLEVEFFEAVGYDGSTGAFYQRDSPTRIYVSVKSEATLAPLLVHEWGHAVLNTPEVRRRYFELSGKLKGLLDPEAYQRAALAILDTGEYTLEEIPVEMMNNIIADSVAAVPEFDSDVVAGANWPEVQRLGRELFDGMPALTPRGLKEPEDGDQSLSIALPGQSQGFFSQLERTIGAKVPNKATPEQILAAVDPARGSGVKAEEIKWSGLQSTLDRLAAENGGKVPKEALLQQLRDEGRIRFEEVQFGGGRASLDGWEISKDPQQSYGRDVWWAVQGDREISVMVTTGTSEEVARQKLADKLNPQARTQYGEHVLAAGEHYREVVLTMEGDEYTSRHFGGTPGYVAHMRLNERKDSTGKPGLFMEEVQSDRHQAARKQPGSVPDAPFRKDWPLQMFKRALRDAVASGKDWIGWTDGDTQIARYDLSKFIDKLEYRPQTGRLYGYQDGKAVVDTLVQPEGLPDVIGKEAAEKLLATEAHEADSGLMVQTLAGQDLHVGGKGMAKFYDVMLPTEIGKYVKKWGAKVEGGEVNRSTRTFAEFAEQHRRMYPDQAFHEIQAAYDRNHRAPFWKVRITDSMRESVAKGQASFSIGPLTPRRDVEYPRFKLREDAPTLYMRSETGILFPDGRSFHMGTPPPGDLPAGRGGLVGQGRDRRSVIAAYLEDHPDRDNVEAIAAALGELPGAETQGTVESFWRWLARGMASPEFQELHPPMVAISDLAGLFQSTLITAAESRGMVEYFTTPAGGAFYHDRETGEFGFGKMPTLEEVNLARKLNEDPATALPTWGIGLPGKNPLAEAIKARIRNPDDKAKVYQRMLGMTQDVRKRFDAKRLKGEFSKGGVSKARFEELRDLATLEAIAKALPVEIRGRYVGAFTALDELKTSKGRQDYMIRLLGKIERGLEVHLQKLYRQAIRRVMDKSRQKKNDSRNQRGKIGAIGHAVAKQANAAMTMDHDAAIAEAAKLREKIESGDIRDGQPMTLADYEEYEGRAMALELFSDYENADSARLERALEFIRLNYSTGRDEWIETLTLRKADREAAIATLRKVLAAPDFITEQMLRDAASRDKKVTATAEGALLEWISSAYQTLDRLKERTTDAAAIAWVDARQKQLRDARGAYDDAIEAERDALMAAMQRIFGTKGGWLGEFELDPILYDLSKGIPNAPVTILEGFKKEQVSVPIHMVEALVEGEVSGFESEKGKQELDDADLQALTAAWEEFQDLPDEAQKGRRVIRFERIVSTGKRGGVGTMSQLEGLKEWLAMRQPDAAAKYEGIGWDAKTFMELEAWLKPEVKQLGLWMVEKLDKQAPALDALHRSEYGIGLDLVPNYFPLLFEAGADKESTVSTEGADVAVRAKTASALKGRVSHRARPKPVNALAAFLSNRAQIHYFMTHATAMRELIGVFRSREATEAIKVTLGPNFMRSLSKELSVIETNGIMQADGLLAADTFVRKLQSGYALGVLGLKLKTLIVNTTAVWNAALGVPARKLVKGFTPEYAKDLKAVFDSPAMQRRLKHGTSHEMRIAMQGGIGGHPLAAGSRRAAQAPMELIRWVDSFSNASVMAAAYRATLEEARAAGLPEDAAKAQAEAEIDRLLTTVAQPDNLLSRSLGEIKISQHPLAGFLFLFASETRKNFSIGLYAARKLLTGKGAVSTELAVQQVIVLGLLYSATGYLLRSAYQALFKAEDDEPEDLLDRLWKRLTDGKAWTHGLMTEHLKGIPLIGEGLNHGLGAILGQRVMDSSPNPLNKITGSAVKAAKSMEDGKTIEDRTQATIDVVQATMSITPETAVLAQVGNAGEDLLGLLTANGLAMSDAERRKRIKARFGKFNKALETELGKTMGPDGKLQKDVQEKKWRRAADYLRNALAPLDPEERAAALDALKLPEGIRGMLDE